MRRNVSAAVASALRALERARSVVAENQRSMDYAMPSAAAARCINNMAETRISPNLSVVPTPSRRANLKTLDGVRAEMARIFRDVRAGRLDAQDAARMCYVLAQIAEVVRIAERLGRH
jgi:hypothetical protein